MAIDREWLGQRGLDVSRAEEAMDRFLQAGRFRWTAGAASDEEALLGRA